MMRVLRSLLPRNQFPVLGSVDEVSITKLLTGFTSHASFSTFGQSFSAKGKLGGRVFCPYAVYKGKASLSVEPVPPTFAKLDSGDLRVDRRGVMMFTFVHAIGERKYDWDKKQRFALSATEVGSLISLGPHDGSEFFHDPSMLSSNAGQVKKSLSVKPLADGNGYFISLSVNNSISKTTERFTVPVTTAEFAVMKTACSFALPHIMGWDWLSNRQPKGVEGSSSKVDPQRMELEWDR